MSFLQRIFNSTNSASVATAQATSPVKYKNGDIVINKPEKKPEYELPRFIESKDDVPPPEITRTVLDLHASHGRKVAFVLDNVLSKDECEELIALTEGIGYEPALINVGMNRQQYLPEIRNNDRCILDDPKIANCILKRILPFLPETWNGRKIVSLNERLRFLRYDPPQQFASHYDGCYKRPNGERSCVTIQLYLNEGMKGGATSFLDPEDEEPKIECIPKIGRVLVFEHHCLHEGSRLVKGRKYTIRTDVMYAASQTEQSLDSNYDAWQRQNNRAG